MVVLATPAALAGALLWFAWWRRAGVRLSALDAPARLLATAVATLPADRRDWGAAMAAELTQVPDRRARWRFAAGCVRTAVFPPRGHRVPALAVAGLAAATGMGTAFAVGRALPEMRVLAVTFVALVGALTTAAVSRARRMHRPAPVLPIAAAGSVGVAGCLAIVGYYLATDASTVLDSSAAVTLAVVLAGCLWLSLAPPQPLTTSRRAGWVGLAAGLAVATGVFAAARLNDLGSREGILLYLIGAPVAVLFVASALVAVVDRSLRAGLQAAIWTVSMTCLLTFAVYVVEEVRFGRANGVALLDGDGPVGENLALHGAIVWVLGFELLWALPFGILGAGLGAIIGINRPGGAASPRSPVGASR